MYHWRRRFTIIIWSRGSMSGRTRRIRSCRRVSWIIRMMSTFKQSVCISDPWKTFKRPIITQDLLFKAVYCVCHSLVSFRCWSSSLNRYVHVFIKMKIFWVTPSSQFLFLVRKFEMIRRWWTKKYGEAVLYIPYLYLSWLLCQEEPFSL